MQSLASRDHELRKELAALPQILPAVQAIPLYIENAVINITNKLVLNQADLEQRLPSESLKGSQRSPRILPPGNTTMPTKSANLLLLDFGHTVHTFSHTFEASADFKQIPGPNHHLLLRPHLYLLRGTKNALQIAKWSRQACKLI